MTYNASVTGPKPRRAVFGAKAPCRRNFREERACPPGVRKGRGPFTPSRRTRGATGTSCASSAARKALQNLLAK